MVYVARNPKDVIVSYFHHHKLFTLQQFTADIEKFADYFMKDERKMQFQWDTSIYPHHFPPYSP